jgi:hypothetical protein
MTPSSARGRLAIALLTIPLAWGCGAATGVSPIPIAAGASFSDPLDAGAATLAQIGDAPLALATIDGETYRAALVGPCVRLCDVAVDTGICFPPDTCNGDCMSACTALCEDNGGQATGPCAQYYYYYVLCASEVGPDVTACTGPGLPEVANCTVPMSALAACLGPAMVGAGR